VKALSSIDLTWRSWAMTRYLPTQSLGTDLPTYLVTRVGS
jgi:hypothetical protein